MGNPNGFKDLPRRTAKKRHPSERVKDWQEEALVSSEAELRSQASRCMDCGTPFCQMGTVTNGLTAGCPLYNVIPEWNELVYRGNWREAYNRLVLTNNFPEFTGRACPAPCEGSCTASIPTESVTIKNIEQAIIDKAFSEGWIAPKVPAHRTGYTVAIVGSGPAGLAAADQLNQHGHSVTVYERDDRPGGLLMYGIPNMKLEKQIVERRVQLLQEEGIEFICDTEIGKAITLEALQAQYDAVIFATGAQKARELNLEGRELSGIHNAMNYLTASTKFLMDGTPLEPSLNAKGKRVIVIGGGDTGADCIATAIRQGCESVVQFGKHPRLSVQRTDNNPWPEPPQVFTLEYSHEEAATVLGKDPREYGIISQAFVGENGAVKGVKTIEMVKDPETGAFSEVDGSEKIWEADLVLIAIGFQGSETEYMIPKKQEPLENHYETASAGLYVAGDARRGQSLIVWAIREGREVANVCHQYLMTAIQSVS
ncbi:glutamate synthase subunit beta [Pullulanibacillus sp. KACC 23026]|uniref:glutamate synthase subunit beta n=1 Tax=Pullulanibacillus sp. KACC 23026 TaxID=3028315 RepID=UPI0023B0CD5F|nr:glutamate synthase subunit beta [Pullulanibacillus sp. KACC 23026]WEG13743.1 glutamate synthase subunit beta [Pullulanibacillus sp. KACC 23026]